MSETSIQMRSGKDDVKTSGDYTVYDAAQVAGSKDAKGLAFLTSAAEQAGRFIEATFDTDGDDLELVKTTSATAKYETPGPAIRHVYISHDVMDGLGGEATDDGYEAPESLGVSIAPSTEEAFEESAQVSESDEEEAEGLLAGVGDDDSVDVEEDDDGDEEAEALLAEAEDAA